MCSKRSSSAALLGVLLLAGCRSALPPPAPAPPEPVFVDVAALVVRHPLFPELVRLRTPAVSPGRTVTLASRWEASLAVQAMPSVSESRSQARVREALTYSAAQAVVLGGASRKERRMRRLEQRRAELLASERSALAERERALREQIERRLRGELAGRIETLAGLRMAEQLYRAQLREGVSGRADPKEQQAEIARLRPLAQPSVRDLPDLKERVNALKRGPDFRPAPRSRMTVMAEAAGGAHREIRGTLDALWEAGERERTEASATARAGLDKRVDARLETLSAEQGAGQAAEIRQELGRALADEARLGARGRRGLASALRRVALQVGMPPETRASAESRAAQLAALIQQDVLARLQDAAQRQRLELHTTPAPHLADRTAQIGGWIGLGERQQKAQ